MNREQALRSMLAGADDDATKNLAQATATLAAQSSEHAAAATDCHGSLMRWRIAALLGFAGWAWCYFRKR